MCRQIWLELLEKNENQRHFVFLWQFFQWRLLDLFNVQVEVFIRLENVWRRVQNVIEELSQEKRGSLVLLLGLAELVLEALVLLKQRIVLLALDYHVALLLL